VEETTTGHQTQNAGNVLAADAGGRAPLQIHSDPWAQWRALEGRRLTQHLQRFLGGHGDERQEECSTTHTPYTPEENKADCKEWNTTRYGTTFHLIREMDRDELIEEGFVSHQATTGSDRYETAEDTRTTDHEQLAESDTVAPTADEVGALPVHLGAYANTPLDVRAGVVTPAVCYVVIDGASWNGDHKPADYYMGWYGDQYGAEQHMRPNSIVRAFQHIPGEESPENRAHDMVRGLQSQGTAPPVGSLWDNFDPQVRPEPRSLAKEVGDSAETAYKNEMYVTPKMVDRWKEIHWLCISARCWKCTYGPDTKAWAHP
jgi:hypothetical protein